MGLYKKIANKYSETKWSHGLRTGFLNSKTPCSIVLCLWFTLLTLLSHLLWKRGGITGYHCETLLVCHAMPECVYVVLMALWQKRFLDIESDDTAWDIHESHFSEIWPFYFHSWGEGEQSETDLEGIIHKTVKLELCRTSLTANHIKKSLHIQCIEFGPVL